MSGSIIVDQTLNFLFRKIMKINEIINETTVAGGVATVAAPLTRRVIKRVQEYGTTPVQKTPDEIKQDQEIKKNLTQLKGAGVDIDPNKSADDPNNAGTVAGAVQKAMADPALATQLKTTLQRAQQK
jgi:hypothetical protein